MNAGKDENFKKREKGKIGHVEVPKQRPKDEKHKCKSCCPCCSNDHSEFDKELVQILSDRKGKKHTDHPDDTENVFSKFKLKKDGCSESGYLSKPKPSLQSVTSMDDLRKSYVATRDLPCPGLAIEINNSGQKFNTKLVKRTPSKERNLSEVNQMLLHRLNGTVVLDDGSPTESGEALLSYTQMSSQFQPIIISHLVHGVNMKRMSFSSELDQNRRRSSFSLRNVDLAIPKVPSGAASIKQQNQLNKENDYNFIKNLPKISIMIKHELESDLGSTQRYIKRLRAVFKDPEFVKSIKQQDKTENWLVILYTSSERVHGSLSEFDSNLVRLILQHHCIVYEERDIALKKESFRTQLQGMMRSDSLKVPYVCAKGFCIGGVQVIFVMHRMNIIKEIFADFIIPHETYVDWLYKRSKSACILTLNVKISDFPSLKYVMSNPPARLTRNDRKITKIGVETLKRSKILWQDLTKSAYIQPSLLRLVLLRNTIMLAHRLLDRLYSEYLPGLHDNLRTHVQHLYLYKKLQLSISPGVAGEIRNLSGIKVSKKLYKKGKSKKNL